MIIRNILIAAASLMLAACVQVPQADLHEVAVKVADKGLSKTDLGNYMGTCLYHGMADLAVATGRADDLKRVTDILDLFVNGEFQEPLYANFIDYEIGGQATAMLAWKGREQYVQATRDCAARMWREQPRTVTTNIMTGHGKAWAPNDAFWIDIAFTVSPFFLYSGLLEGNQEYIDYAAHEALAMCRILHDASNDLYHQGFRHPNSLPEREISEDHWSRGNGWMSMALGALLRDYPHDGKYWEDIAAESRRFYAAICRVQDENGMWHQEMSNPGSFVETSGSAQLLAGLGAAIESGVLDKKDYLPFFEKGLVGLLGYIDPDGSVGHTCMGCCVPVKGTIADFEAKHWYYNENHSFGPAVLALAQAIRLGYKKVKLPAPLGWANDPDRPRAYARIVSESGDDVAWENDRIAFRVHSQRGEHPLAGGVDVWTKTVDYSIIDKWYAGEKQGVDYHIDHGEGSDWYVMGQGRGCGGSGVWNGARLLHGVAYERCEIASDGPLRVDFTLSYPPFEADGETYTETKRIEMVNETSFYRVTHTLTTASGKDAVLAVGLQCFGSEEVKCSEDAGKLFSFEQIAHQTPVGAGTRQKLPLYESDFGEAVVARPRDVAGFAQDGPNHLLLLRIRSGEPVVYYVGASYGFQQNSGQQHGTLKSWEKSYEASDWASLEAFYASRQDLEKH